MPFGRSRSLIEGMNLRMTQHGSSKVARMASCVALAALVALMSSGCSIRRMAVNKLGDALAGGGASFASDDDPDLVKDATPFSLKLMESLIAESPRHKGLRYASASGFTQYAYAFVQLESEAVENKDLAAATALRERARRLYFRARNHGLRGLEITHPGLEQRLRNNARAAVRDLGSLDVPLTYWTAVAWAAAISVSKDNPEAVADLPIAEALMDRALELDEKYADGAIHSFLITYEMSRQGASGDAAERARRHFDRAVELSGRATGGAVPLPGRGGVGAETEPYRVRVPAKAGAGDRSGRQAGVAFGELGDAKTGALAAGPGG